MIIPSLESLLQGGSLLLIFILMLSNGFFSFPSSQILYITVGVFIAQGKVALIPAFLLGALGNTLGNYLLFEITHRRGEHVARKLLPLQDDMWEALKETFKEKSLFYLALGKLTPSLKVFIPLLAGVAKTKKKETFVIFLVTSLIWAAAFLAIGISFGKSFSFGKYGIIMGLIGLSVALYFTSKLQKKILAKTASQK